MTIYTLYVKTHRKTGLKYLGQTSQEPFKYPGSGIDWKSHLKEFGNDVRTEILLQTTDEFERNYWGRYYSALWRVVTAMDDFGNKIWANRIPETGGGGSYGEDNCMSRPEIKQKHLESVRSPKEIERKKKQTKLSMSNAVTKEKHKASLKLAYSTSEKRSKMKSIAKASTEKRMSDGTHNLLGSNNHRFDPTVYSFTHIDGREVKMTKSEFQKEFTLTGSNVSRLVSGERKTHRGWRLS